MAGAADSFTSAAITPPASNRRQATRETPRGSSGPSSAIALGFFAVFLLMPLVAVFVEAFRKGWDTYLAALVDPDALSAIKLTLHRSGDLGAPQPRLRGGGGLGYHQVRVPRQAPADHLIDLPFSVSPVVAGLIYVLVFGAQGWFGPWLSDNDVKVIFAVRASCWPPSSSPSPLLPAS
jgi:sulfate transport system permease protein